MIYRIAADLTLLVHLGFIILVVAGALPVFRYAWFAWLHLPVVTWGVFVELTGRVCPLTTLENSLRILAGQEGYAVGFIERYLMPVIYPAGLTRNTQLWLAGLVVAINAILYALILLRRKQRHHGNKPSG